MRKIDQQVIPQLVQGIISSPYKNLVVGGCSFTSLNFGNNDFYWQNLQFCYDRVKDSNWPKTLDAETWKNLPARIKNEFAEHVDWQHLTYITWPIYTRDYLGISQVIDCSCSGAGNNHIATSVIYELETNPEITPDSTLVVVMWTGYDRDDVISDKDSIDKSQMIYHYNSDVVTTYTGGLAGSSNSLLSMSNLKKIKSDHSRAVENYCHIIALKNYLENKGFQYFFTSYSSRLTDLGFHIQNYLPIDVDDLFTVRPFLGDYAQQTMDGFHPTSIWQRDWSEKILIPAVLQTQ